MNNDPLFIPRRDANGEYYDIKPAGVLLILADSIYHPDPGEELGTTGKARALRMLNNMLAAAVQGGFTQRDVLETMLVRGYRGHRVQTLARQACAAAGDERILEIFVALKDKK